MPLCKSRRTCKEVGQGGPVMGASGRGAPDALRVRGAGFSVWGGGVQQNLGELLKGRGPGPSTD